MLDFSALFSLPESAAFPEIQRHFIDRALNLNAIYELLVALGIVVGLILLIMLLLHFRPRKPYVPTDWITDKVHIANLLGMGISQRAKLELQFPVKEDTRRPSLRCALIAIEKKSLILDASGITPLSSMWEGRTVDCFFMLRRQESYDFYAFASTVISIKQENENCTVQLALPERIESRQKRSYLRITPPDEYMLGAALWLGPNLPEVTQRNDLALWPRPSRLWIPGTTEDFSIRDISSGGLRLFLPRHTLAEDMEYVHISNQFIVMLDLWEPDKEQRVRFWLLCRMQSPVLDFETRGMDIGAQFLAWGKAVEGGGTSLLWLKLASSGEVEPLGNWVMRRHLEIFRDSEQAMGFAQRQQQ